MIDIRRALWVCSFTLLPLVGWTQDSLLESSQTELIDTLKSQDASSYDKAKACQRLAIIGDTRSVGPLVELLDHPELSVYALTALQRIPGQEAEAALLKAIDDNSGRSLTGLLHAVGQRRIKAAVPELAELASPGKTDTASRQAAIRALGRIGGDDARKILVAVKGQLTSKLEQRILADAMLQVGGITSAKHDLSELSRLLAAEEEARFRRGMQLARKLGASASPVVARQIDQLSPQRQAMALICLGDLGDSVGIEAAKQLVESDHPQTALRAVQTLTKLGGWNDVEYPVKAISKPEIADGVARALADARQEKFDRIAIDQLTALASQQAASSIHMQQAVIQYAVSRRLAAATEALLTIGIQGTPPLRTAALEAVGATVSEEQFPSVLNRLTTGELTDDDELKAAMLHNAMVKLPRATTAAVISAELAGADSATKALLLEQLGFLGGKKALQIVSAAARSDDDATVDAATRVLGQWLTADVADELWKLASELPSGKYQRRALRGYLRVGRQLDMPTDKRTQLAQSGYALATRDDERLLALEIFRRYPSDNGMNWIVEALSTSSQSSRKLRNTQFATLAHVAERIRVPSAELVAKTLARLDFSDAPTATREKLRQLKDPLH